MESKWIIVYQSYEGLQKQAVDRLSGAVASETGYVIPALNAETVAPETLAKNHVILVGTDGHKQLDALVSDDVVSRPTKAQGYSLRVCDSVYAADRQMILVLGADDRGVLYGAVDLINHYMGTAMFDHTDAELTQDCFFGRPFRTRMPSFARESAPALDRRGIWTWGHCIYDYRRFLEHMLALRLNQIVIWNDHAPINAKEIVETAHTLGIEVYWGFSWGWNPNCMEPGFRLDDDAVIDAWAEKVLAQYQNDYAPSGADGIYFQSFTEVNVDTLGGVLIAEAVTKWVNRIGAQLLNAYPDLEIQFGLHATSVRTHLDKIGAVDPRIRIVWENCGSFPYGYRPNEIAALPETLAFQEQICTLRGEQEKFGAVLKGMTKLDWSKFEHQAGSYAMGTNPEWFVARRTFAKERIWKILQSYWMQNAHVPRAVIRQLVSLTNGQGTVQMLVEDGCFDEGVFYPVALCAEMLWDDVSETTELVGNAARFPMVRFANL